MKNSLFSIAGAPSQSWAPGSGQYQQGFPQTAHTYPYTMYGYRYPHYDNRWVQTSHHHQVIPPSFPAPTGTAATPAPRQTLTRRCPPQGPLCPPSPPFTPGCGRQRRVGVRASHQASRAPLSSPRRPRAPMTSQTHKQVSGHTSHPCQHQ